MATWLKSLIGFNYRTGPLQYFLGLVVALGFLFFALGSFVEANMRPKDPTGNATPTAFALFAFAWVHAAVSVNRLRDAAAPWWAYVLVLGGPYLMAVLAATSEAIFFIPALVVIPLIFAVPLIFPRVIVDRGGAP
jgi:uncharacterized membrane protein YhaH (DUF805 family)